MDYGCVVPARFLDRPNRFVAHVLLGQETVTCHVKNTGRCRELLVPGARVYLERGRNPGRRTAWDLIAVEKDGKLINMDAQAPNRVFAEWARARYADVHPEVRYGQSRLDFCLDGQHFPSTGLTAGINRHFHGCSTADFSSAAARRQRAFTGVIILRREECR